MMGIGWNMLVGTLLDGMLSGGTIRNGMILDGMGSSFNISGPWTDWLDWLASPLCYLTAALSTHLPSWLTHLLSRFAELRNKQNQVKIQIPLFSCISTLRWKNTNTTSSFFQHKPLTRDFSLFFLTNQINFPRNAFLDHRPAGDQGCRRRQPCRWPQGVPSDQLRPWWLPPRVSDYWVMTLLLIIRLITWRSLDNEHLCCMFLYESTILRFLWVALLKGKKNCIGGPFTT